MACLVPALLLTTANPLHGGVIVSFANSSPLVAGSSGQLDVMIASDSMDILDSFLAEFLLTPLTGPAGGLLFSAMQSDAQLADSNYIFFNRSLSTNTNVSVGAVSNGGATYSGFDATDDGNGPPPMGGNPDPVLVPPAGSEALLVRLDLSAVTAGTYQIELNAGNSSFLADDLNPASELAFSSTPFTLTVSSSTAAVPEPSSAVGLTVLAATSIFVYRRRQRSA